MGRSLILTEIRDHVHLILHQGYQGRDNNSDTVHQQRRQLVAQRLTATRRHQDESVLTIQQTLDDCFLITLKIIETEIFL